MKPGEIRPDMASEIAGSSHGGMPADLMQLGQECGMILVPRSEPDTSRRDTASPIRGAKHPGSQAQNQHVQGRPEDVERIPDGRKSGEEVPLGMNGRGNEHGGIDAGRRELLQGIQDDLTTTRLAHEVDAAGWARLHAILLDTAGNLKRPVGVVGRIGQIA